MIIASLMSLVYVGILLGIVGGVIWFQIVLSKKDSKWPGLILPLISLLLSLSVTLSMAAYYSVSSEQTTNQDGIVTKVGEVTSTMLTDLLPVMVVSSFPTLFLLVIYIVIRNKKKHHQMVERMTIHDL